MNITINLKFRDFLSVSWHSVTVTNDDAQTQSFFTAALMKRVSPELYFSVLFCAGWCVSLYILTHSHSGFARIYGYLFALIMGFLTIKIILWFVRVLHNWKKAQPKAVLSLSDDHAEVHTANGERFILLREPSAWRESHFLYWYISGENAVIIPKRDLKNAKAEKMFPKWLMG